MRLVCPNCEAKYEVPEDAIPETGRDVQCANCGHAWYQMRARAPGSETAVPAASPPAPAPEPAPEPVVEGPVARAEEAPAPVAEPEPIPDEPVVEETVVELAASAEAETGAEPTETLTADAVEVDAEPMVETTAEIIPAFESVRVATDPAETGEDLAEAVVSDDAVVSDAPAFDDDATEPDLSALAAPAAAYAVDDSVLAILREEAEREAQARRAEGARPLETQTDLGIEAALPAAKKMVEPESDDTFAARRTRLPDVEEINSTLRPSESVEDGMGPDGLPVVEKRSGFRSGFILVLTVAILGSAIYVSADAIAEMVPAIAGPLKAYVSFVDSLRLHLDGLMQSATVAINGN
jgi:predicted Zn finger-like uncharacterized protein